MTEALLEGVEIKLGGETYIAPPLSLGGIRKCLASIETIVGGQDSALSEKYLDAALYVIEVAVKRNYPGFTAAGLLESLPAAALYDIGPAVTAIMEASGLVPKATPQVTEPSS